MQNGDLVILSANKPRVLVVEVDGDYEWTEESPFEGDYQHQGRVIVRRDLSPEDIWKKAVLLVTFPSDKSLGYFRSPLTGLGPTRFKSS